MIAAPLMRALLTVAVVAWLAACASNVSTPSGSAGADLVTESDEPEARKRARIRTELASGYFEQGQNAVALDEIKQALAADPAYAPALNLRGLVYMRLGEAGLAEESFRRSLNVAPRDPDVAHNLAWMLCQQRRFSDANALFIQAIGVPNYSGRAKSLMAQGVCLMRAGNPLDAESALTRSFELDPGNPVTAYTLAQVLFRKGDLSKAQFYLRRLNGGELANAETLWLGARVEHRLGNSIAARQLGDQLKRRFPQSKERQAFDRGAFDE
jgi:type IV pilus assembly protein PilF